MAEDIRGLIEKIQEEGIKAGEDKASQIESQARDAAQDIIGKAKSEAQEIIAQAQEKAAKTEESTKTLLKQAGRDLILSLKKEIDSLLNKIIVSEVRQALTADEIIKIITALIKDYAKKDKEEIIISLKKADFEKLEKGFLTKLKEETKKAIVLKPLEDINGGFIISFDAGKSHFDFTDKALAEYISLYLKPQLREILES